MAASLANENNIAANVIPYDSLSITNRMRVRAVTDHYTLLRQHSPKFFKGRIQHFEFLMDHMEACSTLAKNMKLIEYRSKLDEHGRLITNDHQGSKGYLLQVYATEGKRVYWVTGSRPGIFHVRGRGVAVVDYKRVGRYTIEYKGTILAKVDQRVFAALARMFSIFLRGTVDRHFEELIHSPIALSEIALIHPQKLSDAISKMPQEDQDLLDPFASLLSQETNSSTQVTEANSPK